MNDFSNNSVIVKIFLSSSLLESNSLEFGFEVVSNLMQKLICKYIASQTVLIKLSVPEPQSMLDTKLWLSNSSKKQIIILNHQEWLNLLQSFNHKEVILERDKSNNPCAFLLWPKQY